MSIPTPPLAEKIEDTSQTQKKLIRDAIGVNDFPIQTDRTYIVFDADAGNNTLYIDVAGSSAYSILKGDGSQPVSYTDTGGAKTLNYALAGRYIITIDGDFNGLDYRSPIQSFKDQLISVIGGSNYPTTLVIGAYELCVNLESAIFPYVVKTESIVFDSCSKLKNTYFPLLNDIGQECFELCTSLEEMDLPAIVVFVWGNTFKDCNKLKKVNLPLTTSFPGDTFLDCISLEYVNVPALLTTSSAFQGCTKLKEIDLRLATSVSMPGCTSLQKIHLKGGVAITLFANVILTDVYVDGTEAQAIVIQDDIVTAGGLFSLGCRLIYESKDNAFTYARKIGVNTTTPQAHLDINTEEAEATKHRINGEIDQEKRIELRHYDASEAALELNLGFVAIKDGNRMVLGHVPQTGIEIDVIEIDEDGSVYALPTYSKTVSGTNRDLFIDDTGKIGYVSSAKKYKKNIKDLKFDEKYWKLRPVIFDFKEKKKGINQEGYIADEVEKLYPELCSYNETGHVETVQYSKFHLLNTLAIHELKSINSDQNNKIIELEKRLSALEKK